MLYMYIIIYSRLWKHPKHSVPNTLLTAHLPAVWQYFIRKRMWPKISINPPKVNTSNFDLQTKTKLVGLPTWGPTAGATVSVTALHTSVSFVWHPFCWQDKVLLSIMSFEGYIWKEPYPRSFAVRPFARSFPFCSFCCNSHLPRI